MVEKTKRKKKSPGRTNFNFFNFTHALFVYHTHGSRNCLGTCWPNEKRAPLRVIYIVHCYLPTYYLSIYLPIYLTTYLSIYLVEAGQLNSGGEKCKWCIIKLAKNTFKISSFSDSFSFNLSNWGFFSHKIELKLEWKTNPTFHDGTSPTSFCLFSFFSKNISE